MSEWVRAQKLVCYQYCKCWGFIHRWWLMRYFSILSGSNESTWNYDFTPRSLEISFSHSLPHTLPSSFLFSLSHSLTRARLLASTFALSVILFVSYVCLCEHKIERERERDKRHRHHREWKRTIYKDCALL